MNSAARQRLILVIAAISVFFEALDIAIANLTMPLIQQDFGLSATEVQWVQTLYVLLYGGLLILGGRLADTVGRKRVFLLASGIFLLTSLGAGLAPSFGWLLVARGWQGVGAALLMPAALSLVTNAYTEAGARSRAIGVVSAFAAVGSGSGLSLGGLVAGGWGWQAVFFLNVPVILLTLALGARFIPADPPRREALPDIPSGLLLTGIITALSYGVHELAGWRQHGALLLGLGAAILAGGWAFRRRNARQAVPLVDFRVLAPARTAIGVYVCLGASFTGFLFLISLLLQHDQHRTAAQAGLLLFPFSALSAVTGKWLIPTLLRRGLTVGSLAVLGMGALTLSAGWLLVLHWVPGSQWPLLLAMACANGLGIALAYSGLTVLALQGVPEAYHGLATGVATTAYFVGGGLGLSVLSLVLNPATAGGGPVVGPVPLAVLGLYGGIGAGWLLLARWRPPRGSGRAWQQNSLAATGGAAPGQGRSSAALRR